jgi:hypothetical protein
MIHSFFDKKKKPQKRLLEKNGVKMQEKLNICFENETPI